MAPQSPHRQTKNRLNEVKRLCAMGLVQNWYNQKSFLCDFPLLTEKSWFLPLKCLLFSSKWVKIRLLQKWRSGWTRTIRNRVMQECIRGFESLFLRQVGRKLNITCVPFFYAKSEDKQPALSLYLMIKQKITTHLWKYPNIFPYYFVPLQLFNLCSIKAKS